MFRCEITGENSKPGEKLTRLVIETRNKVYRAMVLNEELRRYEEVEVGSGYETVKELLVTEEGLNRWNAMSEEQRNLFR